MQTVGLDAILKAIDVALDRRKLLLAFGGALAILVVAGIIMYVGSLVDNAIIAAVFGLLALIAAWALSALFSGALTHMSWQKLTAGRDVGASDALSFSLQHIVGFALSPLALALVALAVVIVEVVLMLLGRIPYLGELWVALIFLPLVLVNIVLFVGIAAGSWLVYPIVAESGAGPVHAVRRVIELVRRSPGRLISYFILALVVIALAVLIIWPLVSLGLSQTYMLMVGGVGVEKMGDLLLGGLFGNFMPDLPGLLGGFFPSRDIPFTIDVARFLLGVEVMALLAAVVYAFPWVFVLTMSCAVYASLTGAPTAQPQGPPAAAQPPQPVYQPPQPAYQPPQPAYQPPAYDPPAAYQPPQAVPPTVQQPSGYPAVQPTALVCVSCGKQIKTGTRFCPFCGQSQS